MTISDAITEVARKIGDTIERSTGGDCEFKYLTIREVRMKTPNGVKREMNAHAVLTVHLSASQEL